MNMYYFYINYPNLKDRTILIHHGDCGNCQNGTGKQGSGSNEKGFWTGSFSSLSDAETALELLVKLFKNPPNTGNCSCCK
jgi:hypothetical protein